MTEMEYGGGGPAHGWERSIDQLVCLEVPPCPCIYNGARGRPAGPLWARQEEEHPPFLLLLGGGKEGGEGGKGGKRGRPPSPIRFGLGGSRALPPLFHHLAHEAHYFFLVFP